MTQSATTIEQPNRQIEIVNYLVQGMNHDTIAKQLNVSRSTIERDIDSFVNSEHFSTWLKQEWLRLHQIMLKEDKKECYRALSMLIRRGGIDINIKEEIREIKLTWDMSAQSKVDADAAQDESNSTNSSS